MITMVKKLKDVGVFKDYESKKTGLSKDFGKKNFIYGLNTYGKSTLCDVFKDISDNSNLRIAKRLTIPDGANQEVIVGLSDGNGVIKLSENGWFNNKLVGKIMVFDTEFMINNVFDGTQLIEDRVTKENFTEFILGDKGVTMAQEIETLKREVKEDKGKLQTLVPYSQRGETDGVIKKYIKQEVKENIVILEKEKEELSKQIATYKLREKNSVAIREYREIDIPNCNKLKALISEIERIKFILDKSYTLSANTLVTFQQHIQNACHGLEGAQTWITQGVRFLNEGSICPFCGQVIEDRSLINAFSEYLCEDYQIFKKEIYRDISSFRIDWDVFTLSDEIILLQKKIKKAEELLGDSVTAWNDDIENLYQQILVEEKTMKIELDEYRKEIETALNSKQVLCNVSIKLDVALLDKIKKYYDEKIVCINERIKKINQAIALIKNEVGNGSFEEKNIELINRLKEIESKITRIKEDDDCKRWKTLNDLIESKNKEIKEKSDLLEQDQKSYLDTYFSTIDNIFKSYGARKFKIERGDSSNKGFKKVFGVNILFNDVVISKNGMSESVFSESDKRALALAVFIAKIECMPEKEKRNIILVLDDPITSFDDNRMKAVINNLINISDTVNQTFIFSHNFNFSKRFSDMYSQQINFYKIDRISGDTKGIYEIDSKEEFLIGFDRKYKHILKFNNEQADSMTENDLRIFLEEYLKIVFAKHYEEYGLANKPLGDRIDELERLRLITKDVRAQLHYYRTELNSGSHTFQMNTIEDNRNFSVNFIKYLFDNIHMG